MTSCRVWETQGFNAGIRPHRNGSVGGRGEYPRRDSPGGKAVTRGSLPPLAAPQAPPLTAGPAPQNQSRAAACADSTASLVGRVLEQIRVCASPTRAPTADRAILTLAFSLRSGEPRPAPALHPLHGRADTRVSLSLISLLSSQPILYFSSLSVLYLFHHFPYSLCSLLFLFNWL